MSTLCSARPDKSSRVRAMTFTGTTPASAGLCRYRVEAASAQADDRPGYRHGVNATRPQRALRQRQLAIPVRRHRFAARAKGGMAATVAHDPAHLLARDIAVDAGHPRIHFGE